MKCNNKCSKANEGVVTNSGVCRRLKQSLLHRKSLMRTKKIWAEEFRDIQKVCVEQSRYGMWMKTNKQKRLAENFEISS